ncbi:uncharacterized protein LOC143914753 [Arctopsyche grandis]|uniref:uncharacterized protein LOC143914753 n=1 Tax=Arctopsyche grandis TaxID=121162 RepID=UPI00406D767A
MSASEDEVDILGDTPPASVSTYSDILKCDYLNQPHASSWLLDSSTAPSWCDNIQQDYGNIFDLPNNCLVSDDDQQPSTSSDLINKWTDSEKRLLLEGIDIYDNDVHKLSSFVGSKTVSEVKSFIESDHGLQLKLSRKIKSDFQPTEILKSEDYEYNELLTDNDIPASIEEVISMVSTAETTVPNNKRKMIPKQINRTIVNVHKSLLKNSQTIDNLMPIEDLRSNSLLLNKNIDDMKYDSSHNSDEMFIRNILRSHMSSDKNVLKGTDKKENEKIMERVDKYDNDINSFFTKRRRSSSFNKKKIKTQITIKNLKSKGNLYSNKINKGHSSLMQIVTGSGQILPLSEGEQVIKIDKTSHTEVESDIEIDIDDDACFENQKKPQKISTDITLVDSSPIKTIENDTIDIPIHMKPVLESTPVPECEWKVSSDEISQIEKFLNPDFFKGSSTKTPERYLLIRSHLINVWQESKPNYLSKTTARNGLKNCGDVNCISRIHTVLEQIGAINFGCEQTVYIRPLTDIMKKNIISESAPIENLHQSLVSDVPRQRKKKLILDGDGGYTITHSEYGEIYEAIAEPKQHRPKKKPVNLIHCRLFDNEHPAPYSVHIYLSSLILMDVHSYTSKAEVMGLLGGEFLSDQNVILIKKYIPCDSLENSGTHCDMCPVSQSRASNLISQQGLKTVGWYHSHPLFPPQPSAQDILSQADLQMAFSPHPFVAVIVSPFWPPGRTSSQYKCFITKQECVESGVNNTAYKFKTNLYCDLDNQFGVKNLLLELENLYNKQRSATENYLINFKTDICINTNMAYLEKCISSIKYHLNACNPKVQGEIRESIISGLVKILT